jgi:hypothetical protein
MESAQPDCIAISGVYYNSGTTSHGTGRELATILTRNMKLLNTGISTVAIEVTKEGRLDITPNSSEPDQAKQFFADKDEYRCVEGKIEIPYFETQAVNGHAVLSYAAKGSLTLSRATDGGLVVGDSGVAMGLMLFIIPFPMVGSELTRYERVVPGR